MDRFWRCKPVSVLAVLLILQVAPLPLRVYAAEADLAAAQQSYEEVADRLDRLASALDAIERHLDKSVFEIDALAPKLGPDPSVAFAFVRDSIRYEPYVGVLRGARGTLIARAGNALDRSLLLAALLAKAGHQVEIAAGTLDEQTARRLAERVFEPETPPPPALPDPSAALADILQQLEVGPDELAAFIEARERENDQARQALLARVSSDDAQFRGMLDRAGVAPVARDVLDEMIAEARAHYWVRYRTQAGEWVDLDPAFLESASGRALAKAERSFAPDKIPEALFHRMGVKVTLRVAEPDREPQPKVTDIVLIDQDFVLADRQGVGIRVGNVPYPSNILSSGGDLSSADIREYVTVLAVGDQQVRGNFFDLSGRVYASEPGSDAGNAERAATAGKAALGGAADVLSGLLDDVDEAPLMPKHRIIGQWAEFRLISPGPEGAAPRVRTIRRDIVPPETVSAWSPEAATATPAEYGETELRRRLFWSVELLPVTESSSPDYLAYVQLGALLRARESIRLFVRQAAGLPTDMNALAERTPTPAVVPLLLAVSASEELRDDMAQRASQARAYRDRPALIGFETAAAAAPETVVREGLDIMASPLRVVAPETGAEGADRVSLQLMRGVRETNLERMLVQARRQAMFPALADATDSIGLSNLSTLMEAAVQQGIGWLVLQPGADALRQLSDLPIPAARKADLAAALAEGDILVVPRREVTLGPAPRLGWWRIAPDGSEARSVMDTGRGDAASEQVLLVPLQIATGGITFFLCVLGAVPKDAPPGYTVPNNVAAACVVAGIGGGIGAGQFKAFYASGLIGIVTAALTYGVYRLLPE